MASRDDVDILWHLSPRLILVRQPSDNISIQDLHDTLRDREQEQANLIYPRLISTAGGENLGGGVQVGLTATLENARIGFQSHKQWVASGLVTQTEPTGTFLIDDTATFVTSSGVNPGNWIVNLDDGSIATVLNVDSETQLTVDVLEAGDTNTFASGHRYRIMEVIQVEVDGGNLVAVDELNNEIDAIFPTAGNQPVRTSASSATQRADEQLEFATFQGFIWVDSSSPYAGTKYPVGSPGYPVNNIADANSIANYRGIPQFKVFGPLTLTGAIDLSSKVFSGHSAVTTTLTVDTSVQIDDTEFNNCTIQGVLDGGAVIRESRILDLEYVNGFIYRCAIDGTITLGGGVKGAILSSYSNVPGSVNTAIVDFNGAQGNDLVIRDYSGGITLRNSTGPVDCSIDMSSGQVRFENTITDGTFTVRGICKVVDNSTGTATVNIDQVLQGDIPAADTFWGRPVSTYTDNTTMAGWILGKMLTVARFLGLK